jgi:hypothetical protein
VLLAPSSTNILLGNLPTFDTGPLAFKLVSHLLAVSLSFFGNVRP